jgi:tetratricopeptide (TPR) repeat protein
LPMSTHTRNAHGYALLGAGRYAEAIAQFEVYARLAPREPNPSDSLGDAYLWMGHADKALDAYSRARTVDPTFTSHNSRAWCLAVLGRYDEALAEPIDLMHYKAIILSRVGRYREAVQAIAAGETEARAGGDRPREGGLRLVAALLAIERKDPERALRVIRTVGATFAGQPIDLERRGRVATALLSGLAHLQAGRLSQALSDFEAQARDSSRTTQIERTWRHAFEAEIALARGDLQQAATAFSGAEPLFRTFDSSFVLPSVMLNGLPTRDGLARVALARGDLDGAIGIYRRLLAYGPESKWIAPMEPLYVLQIARLLEKQGDRKMALTEYQRFLQLWKSADAELPELAEARRAVRRLG